MLNQRPETRGLQKQQSSTTLKKLFFFFFTCSSQERKIRLTHFRHLSSSAQSTVQVDKRGPLQGHRPACYKQQYAHGNEHKMRLPSPPRHTTVHLVLAWLPQLSLAVKRPGEKQAAEVSRRQVHEEHLQRPSIFQCT